jgi:hypothetical protein
MFFNSLEINKVSQIQDLSGIFNTYNKRIIDEEIKKESQELETLLEVFKPLEDQKNHLDKNAKNLTLYGL